MADDRKIKVAMADGTMSEGTEIPVVTAEEPWTKVELKDGAALRMKNVIISVIRLEGKFDQEGSPIYIVKAAQAVSVDYVPDELKKK